MGALKNAAPTVERLNPFASIIERHTAGWTVPEIVKQRIELMLVTHGARNDAGTSVVERTAEQRKSAQLDLARSRREQVLLSTLPQQAAG